jgi:2-isopropylmalate synthase
MDSLRPIIGINAFTHTADLHVKAVKVEPRAYEAINPKILGRRRRNIKKT